MKKSSFYDFGPNENYLDSLEALRVASRMPAGLSLPKNTYPRFLGFLGFEKPKTLKQLSKNLKRSQTTQTTIYWVLNRAYGQP